MIVLFEIINLFMKTCFHKQMKTSLREEVFWMCFFICFSLFNLMLMLYLLSQLKKVRLGQSNILPVKSSSLALNPLSISCGFGFFKFILTVEKTKQPHKKNHFHFAFVPSP